MFDVPFDQMVQTELVPGLKRIERNGKAASADKRGSNRGRLTFSRLGELAGLELRAGPDGVRRRTGQTEGTLLDFRLNCRRRV